MEPSAKRPMTHDEATRRFYAHVWPHRAVVLRTARFMTGRGNDADDLAQETLLKAFRAIDTFDVSTNAQAWLMTILRHAHIDRLRGDARGPGRISVEDLGVELQDTHPARSTPDPVDFDALLEQLSDQQVIDGLRRLPVEISWSLMLVDVQQMSYGDAAAVLHVPEGTVKSRVHRGRQMLREELVRISQPTRDGGNIP
jgi:RNA polymerase sigma-70 factor (ECF subfamily)